MPIISSRLHGLIDYASVATMLGLPRLAGWSEELTNFASGLGAATLGYSLLTRYELGLVKLLPYGMHLMLDTVAAGLLLNVSRLFPGEDEDAKKLLLGFGAFAGAVTVLSMGRKTDSEQARNSKYRKQLIAWLKDAYAMEIALLPILKNHAKDAKHFPEVRERIQEHVEQTKNHAQMVKECLARLGEKPCKAKSGAGAMMGIMQSVASGPFKDEIVKDFLADFAAESFEVASYEALISAAQVFGDAETARVCEQIRNEDQEMADWLEAHLSGVTEKMMGVERER